MSNASFSLGGVDYSELFSINHITMPFFYRENTTKTIGSSDGSRFMKTRNESNKITIIGTMIDQQSGMKLSDTRDQLIASLIHDEPQQLMFSHFPGKYFNAILDGEQDYDLTRQELSEATLTFIVPDGLAHALTETSVSSTSGATLTVTNSGSAPTAPVLTAMMAADNGLVSWVNDQGAVLQFGNPDEVDGVQHDDSQTSYHFDFLTAPTGTTLNKTTVLYTTYPYGNSPGPNSQVGTFDYNTKNKDAATPIYNRVASDRWAGPSLSGAISANSLGVKTGNFIFANRLNIATGIKQLGRVEFNLLSGSNLALSIVLRDSLGGADVLTLEFWVQGKNYYVSNLNRKLFINGFYEARITKLGDVVTFRLAKINNLTDGVNTNAGATVSKSYNVAGLSSMVIDGYNAWFAGFSNTPGWTINWSDSYFKWINVDYWQDLPNQFGAGDIVTADVATKTIYVNGVEEPSLQTVGNMWDSFMLSPGSNDIQLFVSSWADPAKATIQYREAWY